MLAPKVLKELAEETQCVTEESKGVGRCYATTAPTK